MVDELNIVIMQSRADLGDSAARLGWLDARLLSGVAENANLLVLPELFQCGYNAGHSIVDMAEPSDGVFAKAIAKLAITHNVAIAYGYAENVSGTIYNSAQCIDKVGKSIGHHRKLVFPPGFESSLFTAGDTCTVFKLGEFNLSFLICYDAEFPENVRQAAAAGADLVIVPTALGDAWGVVSEKLIPTRAFENGVFVAYVNHCGTENELTYYGGSCVVTPAGTDLVRADGNEQSVKACLKKSEVADAQRSLPYLVERLKLPWE